MHTGRPLKVCPSIVIGLKLPIMQYWCPALHVNDHFGAVSFHEPAWFLKKGAGS